VVWGGLGYSVPNASIPTKFPFVSGAIKQLGGFNKLESALLDQLIKSYPGGVEDNSRKLLSVKDDPGLMFNVALDFEQTFAVPSEDVPGKDIQVSFVYAVAQVLFLDLPRDGAGSGGDLKILYSFPFRVQWLETLRANNRADQEQSFAKLLTSSSPNLVGTFGQYVSTKKFKDANAPKRIKVRSVSVTPESSATLEKLGITPVVDAEFIGRTITVSLADVAGISILPYAQSDALNKSLAERFDRFPDISRIFKRLNDDEANDYALDIVFHRCFSILDNSNNANNVYTRGVSFMVKATDLNSNKVVFNKKIQLINSNALPKRMLDRIKDYDARYMSQIIILLFDTFSMAVSKEDAAQLKQIGLDPAKDGEEIKMLKTVLSKCKYG